MTTTLVPLIRRAVLGDLDSIVQIWLQSSPSALSPNADKNCADVYQQRIARHTGHNMGIWVAEHPASGRLLGFQSLLPFGQHPGIRDFHAESSTYVDAEYQRSGVGRALLTHTLSLPTELHTIFGIIPNGQTHSHRLVSSLGFEKVSNIGRPSVATLYAFYPKHSQETETTFVPLDS